MGLLSRTHLWQEYIEMHLEHLNMFMERTRNYREVQLRDQTIQNHLGILLILKGPACYFQRGRVAWPFNFPWHFSKTWKAEVLLNLTYASDQLIKGVSWCTVNQNCAWFVLKLGGMPLNEKNSKVQMVTVKKQNIVIEYVCCWEQPQETPFMWSAQCFSFTHSN